MESVSEWSDLVPDLLLQIASKLTLLEDFLALRGVCRWWRAQVTRDKFAFVSKVPLLMLSEKDDVNNNVREFYSLCKGRVCMRMSFPEATGRRCIDAGFGWILTAPARNTHGQLVLIKLGPPMTASSCRKIQLPSTPAFPGYRDRHFIRGAALSANPSETSDFVLMVSSNTHLGFWRYGRNNCWTEMNNMKKTHSICCHKQKLYAIDHECNICEWDPSANMRSKLILSFNMDFLRSFSLAYLVGSTKGELLLITRDREFDDTDPYGFPVFRIVRIDITNWGDSELINSLDGDAAFLGLSSAVCVVADDFPDLVKPNRIYFTDDYTESFMPCVQGGHDMGIFNLEEKSIERFHVKSFSFICPPIWVFSS